MEGVASTEKINSKSIFNTRLHLDFQEKIARWIRVDDIMQNVIYVASNDGSYSGNTFGECLQAFSSGKPIPITNWKLKTEHQINLLSGVTVMKKTLKRSKLCLTDEKRWFQLKLFYCLYYLLIIYVMLCATWYHFHNSKLMKNTNGKALLLVKPQASASWVIRTHQRYCTF